MAEQPDNPSGTFLRLRLSTCLEGAGIAILLTLGLTWNQLSPSHLDLYHKLLPITTVIRAITLGLVAATLLATAALWLLERLDPSSRSLLWALLLAGLAARTLSGLTVAQVVDLRGVTPLLVFSLTAGVLLLLGLLRRSWYASAIRTLRMSLLLLGFCILWILPTLLVAGFARQPRDRVSLQNPLPPAAAPHRRIVWILFDELSFDQTFSHRWPGLALPSFDRLRSQSTTFSSVQPNGYYTEEVIPSLLLGRPIADVRSTSAGELLYRSPHSGGWTRFDGNASLFADARQAGWTTGISGDYNPYCRILKNQLDWCWMELIVFGSHLDRDKSSWENFTAPLHAACARLLHRSWEPAPSETERFAGMIDSARRLIATDDVDFAFIHLYLPHPPGIYDRKTEQIKFGGSYIDNLALSDRVLGELDSTLAQTAAAARTTLIVSSDHSWRVGLWRNGRAWTREDEAASRHGQFDPRPLLMVRLPGQTAPQPLSRPLPLLALHGLIEEMLAGGIQTPQQLESWAARR